MTLPDTPGATRRLAAPTAVPVQSGPVRSGAELVALAERFSQTVFVALLCFAGLATLAALAFLPLRSSAEHGRPPASAVAAAIVVLLTVGFAVRRAPRVYWAMRRSPRLELVAVTAAALLLSVVSPLRNELWWPACAILMVVSALVPWGRAMAYVLVVLLANLLAHLLSGSLAEASAVGIIGLWIGLPFWASLAAIIPDRLTAQILTLHAPASRLRDARVEPSEPVGRMPDDRPVEHPAGAREAQRFIEAPRPEPGDVATPLSRLTARQLQVVALLADGLRYGEIALCLSISVGQVGRHVAAAVDRLGVRSPQELVAVAIREGFVPRPDTDGGGR